MYVKQNNKKFHIKECVWNKTMKCFTQKKICETKQQKSFTHKRIYVKQNNKMFHIKKNICETKQQNVSHEKYVKQNNKKFHTKRICETKQ